VPPTRGRCSTNSAPARNFSLFLLADGSAPRDRAAISRSTTKRRGQSAGAPRGAYGGAGGLAGARLVGGHCEAGRDNASPAAGAGDESFLVNAG
jgi:hypothetical protein